MKLLIVSKNGYKDDNESKVDWVWRENHQALLDALANVGLGEKYDTIDRISESSEEIEECVQEIISLIGKDVAFDNDKIFTAIKLLRKLENDKN